MVKFSIDVTDGNTYHVRKDPVSDNYHVVTIIRGDAYFEKVMSEEGAVEYALERAGIIDDGDYIIL